MYTFASLAVIGLWFAAAIGWIINLVEVVKLAAANVPVTSLFVVKAIGIVVAPVGSLCGLFF